jgi:alanyl-tRNA synthetase
MGNSDSGGWIVLAALALGIYTCSGSGDRNEDAELIANELNVSEEEASNLLDTYGNPQDAIDDYADAYRGPFDEDAARDAAEEQLASESYDYSYGCTDDCSGHEAGWRRRAENGYTTTGNSQSFYEGGLAFDDAVEDRVREMEDAYENGEDPY